MKAHAQRAAPEAAASEASEKPVAARAEKNPPSIGTAPAAAPKDDSTRAVATQTPEPKKAVEPKRAVEPEKAREDKTGVDDKRDFDQRNPRGRGATRPTSAASSERAPAAPCRLRDPNAEEQVRAPGPTKIVTKGPRLAKSGFLGSN